MNQWPRSVSRFLCALVMLKQLLKCGEPAISPHSHHVSLVQWTTRLLPITRDLSSKPLGGLISYLIASCHKGPGFKSPGGYFCETGILLLALSRYRIKFIAKKNRIQSELVTSTDLSRWFSPLQILCITVYRENTVLFRVATHLGNYRVAASWGKKGARSEPGTAALRSGAFHCARSPTLFVLFAFVGWSVHLFCRGPAYRVSTSSRVDLQFGDAVWGYDPIGHISLRLYVPNHHIGNHQTMMMLGF